MHRLLARAQPDFRSVLLVESGPRKVTERVLPFLYNVKGVARLDLLTCYPKSPAAFDFGRGNVYSVNDHEVRANRGAFIRKLSSEPYTVLALLCTGSPILLKWKWVLAARSAARLIAVNEDAHYFSLDVWNLNSARRMMFQRLNPFADYTRESFGALVVTFLAGLFLAPFSIAYLALYTLGLHVRRWLRHRRALPSQSAAS